MYAQARQRKVVIMSWVMISILTASSLTPLGALALSDETVLTNNDSKVTSLEVGSALANVDGILEASDDIKTGADSDSAITATVANVDIEVPRDLSDGVGLDALTIDLPNADAAKNATGVAEGTVAYPAANGSANAVQVTDDGGVRMLTVIDNTSAATEYKYDVSIPNGGNIALLPDGGAEVTDSDGEVLAVVNTPWAKDAAGMKLNTYYTTDGQSLVQHVEHNVAGVTYPVVADPIWFVVSGAVFWWAVARCGAGGIIGSVFSYVGGDRSPRAMAAAGAAGCISSFIGGWGILRNMIRVIRL